MNIEDLIREMASSTSIRQGIDAPFAMSEVKVEKVGYADIPIVYVTVTHSVNTGALVCMARREIYMVLEAAGIPSGCIELSPSVQQQHRGKRCRFTDQNPDSKSHGKSKMGYVYRYGFGIKKPKTSPGVFMEYFEWDGRYGRIPRRGS